MSIQEQPAEVEPYTEQEPFLWDSHRYYGFISGVGAGKTAVGVMRTALNAEMWNKGSMGAIVAPSTRMIKNAIFPVMKEFGIYNKWDFSGFQAEEPGFQTPDGGRIVILSADNERTVERLANLNLSFWWLDEAKETPKRARDVLKERLRVGDYRNGYITTTPNGYDHNYDFFVGDAKETGDLDTYMHGDATIYEAGNKLCIGEVPSWANPHTPEDYHEEMQNLPDEIRAQQAEGRFVEVGSGVFTKDMISFASPDELADRNHRYVVGVDVGVEADAQTARDNDSDYWAASLLMVDGMGSRAYLIDSLRKRGMTLKQGISWIRNIVSDVPNPEVYVESNQSQRWLKQELQDQGLNARAVMNTTNKEERLVQLTIPIERGDIQFLNRNIDENIGYDPRFQNLISEMLSFPEGSHDDLLDSLDIAVHNLDLGNYNNIIGVDPYNRDNE